MESFWFKSFYHENKFLTYLIVKNQESVTNLKNMWNKKNEHIKVQ